MLNKLKNLTSYFKRNEILAIDLSNDVVRAVVMKKESGKAVVLSAAEVLKSPQFTVHSPQKKEDIEHLLEKLGKYPRRTVLISPEVKFLTAELPIPASTKISSDKLQEAVRWEAQAYLDFSASEGLFGYQLQTDNCSIKEEFFNRADKTGKNTPVLITAISKQAYSRLAQICKKWHINLQGVYTKENVFVFSTNRFSKEAVKIGPQYAPAIEAALQQLKIIGSGKLGINDKIPLIRYLKIRIHLLPLVMVGIFALGFLTHYAYIKSSFWRYSSRIEKVKVQKSQLSANISALKDLKSRIRDTYEKKHYIERLPDKNKCLLGLFDGITRVLPYDVILDRIIQDGDDGSSTFLLEGSGLSAGSITKFVGELERLEVAQEAKLQSINEKKISPESERLFLYEFKIKVVLRENG